MPPTMIAQPTTAAIQNATPPTSSPDLGPGFASASVGARPVGVVGAHRTVTLVTHLVCSTPGRFGAIRRSGNPWSRCSGLAVQLQREQRVAIVRLPVR